MNIYKVKFGETTPDGSYTDDVKIAASNIIEAADKATKIAKRRTRWSMEEFEIDKGNSDNETKQREGWLESAKESNAVTSIQFGGSLEEP